MIRSRTRRQQTREEHMSDTIALLDTIYQDTSLRHASASELALTPERADTPTARRAAVISIDRSYLTVKLGHKPMRVPQNIQLGHAADDPGVADHAEPLHSRVPAQEPSVAQP